jgi:hypothetical protein
MEDDPHTPAQDTTAEEHPEANDERTLLSRRVVLAALAVGAAGTIGETLRRFTPLDEAFTGGLWFSPDSFPVATDRVMWIDTDTGGESELWVPDRLPVSWTASGLGWSVATDRRSAVEGLPQVPGVFVEVADDGSDADAVLVAPDSLPEVWTAGGAELVIDETLAAARATHSGRTPAVLWGADHTWEVVVDE